MNADSSIPKAAISPNLLIESRARIVVLEAQLKETLHAIEPPAFLTEGELSELASEVRAILGLKEMKK